MLLMLAQEAQPAASGSLFGMFVPMILVFGVFYFLLIRPQQKQAKKHQQMVSELKSGDEVVTRSGFHGKVVSIEDVICSIELGQNVRVKMNKDQVAAVKTAEITTAANG